MKQLIAIKSSLNKKYYEIDSTGIYSFKSEVIGAGFFQHAITPNGAIYSVRYKLNELGEVLTDEGYSDLNVSNTGFTEAFLDDFIIDVSSIGSQNLIVEFSYGI